jgi:hypothetical protein
MQFEISPAAELRASLARLRKTVPFVIGEALAPVLRELESYVGSVERRFGAIDARLQGLDKMPSAAALELLTAPSPVAVMPGSPGAIPTPRIRAGGGSSS